MLDEYLRPVALIQRELRVRKLVMTLAANGDVQISSLLDDEGGSAVPYALVDRVSEKLLRQGKIAKPKL